MKRLALLSCTLGLMLLLGGCVTYVPTIPEGYSGPRATVRDTALTHSSSKVDFFVAERVNGGAIESSINKTLAANYGRGFMMDPKFIEHELPAGKAVTISVRGRTEYAAPILALTQAVYEVKGEISFTPEDGHIYAVKGTLGENYSAVWIEDTGTQQVVGRKVEVNGSAKLGFFQK